MRTFSSNEIASLMDRILEAKQKIKDNEDENSLFDQYLFKILKECYELAVYTNSIRKD